ncbi:hypothetical protein K8I28_05930 [bacterium]|nr:hypothetical protein [bacterium]
MNNTGENVITPEGIRELITPLFAGSLIELLDVQLRGGRGRIGFAIILDHTERGITLKECTMFSRQIEELLDMAENFPREYALEVTSPGVGHPLRYDWQFRKNIGRKLKINLVEVDEKGRPGTFNGELTGVSGEELQFKDGTTLAVREIAEAKVQLPW